MMECVWSTRFCLPPFAADIARVRELYVRSADDDVDGHDDGNDDNNNVRVRGGHGTFALRK